MRDTPLPPSMEKAYHAKCIELKRRLREIEEANDAAVLRKLRLDRAISKLRITRAFLIEQVAKVQLNPDGVETDKSESPPPTVLYNSIPYHFDPPQSPMQALPKSQPPYDSQQPDHWFQQPHSQQARSSILNAVQVASEPFQPFQQSQGPQDAYFNSLQQPVMNTSSPNPVQDTVQPLYTPNQANSSTQKPQKRPARVKRVNRRSSPALVESHRSSVQLEPLAPQISREFHPAIASPFGGPPHQVPVQIAPALHHRASLGHPVAAPPLQALAAAHVQPHPSPIARMPVHQPNSLPPPPLDWEEALRAKSRQEREQLPLIKSLPNGTSVMLIGPNEPKPAPWTIRDLGPQHQINVHFERFEPERQELCLFDEHLPYLPYDIYGRAVCVEWDKEKGRYKHVFPDDPLYKNPVEGNIRTDTPDRRRRIVLELMRTRIATEEMYQREMRKRELEARGETERPGTHERRESGRGKRDRDSRGAVVPAPADDDDVPEVMGSAAVADRSSLDGAADETRHRRRESGRNSVASNGVAAVATSPPGGSPPAGAGGFTAANAPGGPAGR